MLEAAVLVVFPMLVAFAGASDLLTMTIQNRVSVLLIAGFCGLAILTGLPLSAWGSHGLGLLAVFLPGFAFFAAGWMGGGDVKLIGAIGLWFGLTPELLAFVVLVSIYGCVLTLAVLSVRRLLVVLPAQLAGQGWLSWLHDARSGIPYGIAIAAAALQIYPSTSWFAIQ